MWLSQAQRLTIEFTFTWLPTLFPFRLTSHPFQNPKKNPTVGTLPLVFFDNAYDGSNPPDILARGSPTSGPATGMPSTCAADDGAPRADTTAAGAPTAPVTAAAAAAAAAAAEAERLERALVLGATERVPPTRGDTTLAPLLLLPPAPSLASLAAEPLRKLSLEGRPSAPVRWSESLELARTSRNGV